MKRDLPIAINYVHTCRLCAVSFDTAEELDEHELNGCDPLDLQSNAARNADDQLGCYGGFND